MTKKLAALIGGALLVAGCAHPVSVDDLNEVRALAQGAQTAANDAQRVANDARQMAQAAQSAANQALSTAQEALECCEDNTARIDALLEEITAK